MTSKSSRINLYSSDLLSEKGCYIEATDALTTFQSPNVTQWNAPQIDLAGSSNPAHDITNLQSYLASLSNTVSATETAHDAQIASLTTAVNAYPTNLAAETSARVAADAQLQTFIDGETASRQTADQVNTDAIAAEAAARDAADVTMANNFLAGDNALQSQIDALGVVDVDTLAQINTIITNYNAADTSLIGQVNDLTTRMTDVEDAISTLTA